MPSQVVKQLTTSKTASKINSSIYIAILTAHHMEQAFWCVCQQLRAFSLDRNWRKQGVFYYTSIPYMLSFGLVSLIKAEYQILIGTSHIQRVIGDKFVLMTPLCYSMELQRRWNQGTLIIAMQQKGLQKLLFFPCGLRRRMFNPHIP